MALLAVEESIEVAIALVWRDARLLLTRRPPGTHLGGLWEFPGGKLEPGETPEACAERETFEETRLVVRAEGRREAIRHDYPERSVTLHPVDCAWISGEPEAREVSAFAWVAPAELSGYELPAANRELVRRLVEGRR